MNKYQKLGLVAGQIFAGLGFALVGGIIGILVDYLRSIASGMMTDLFGSILTTLIFCYVGLFIGICFDGYRFLKRTGRQKEFSRLSFQSFGGLIIGLFLLFMTAMFGSKLPHALINTLAILLPLLGTILGFDYKIDQVEHNGNA